MTIGMKEKCCTKGQKYYRNWFGFFILGCINNLAYVVINSAAQSLAIAFDARPLVGLIPWANVAVGFLFRFVNMCMDKVATKFRVSARNCSLCCLFFSFFFFF
jgi:battenin